MTPDSTGGGLARQLGLRGLSLAVVTATIGSGWLFAPFYAARMAGPALLLSLAFVLSSWAISWCGVHALQGALAAVLVPGAVFVAVDRWSHQDPGAPPLDLGNGLWWGPYLLGILAITGGIKALALQLLLLTITCNPWWRCDR